MEGRKFADMYAKFWKMEILNELGGNVKAAYRFSDADGVLTGKSGWSFGVSQLDINNNPSAILCLREIGFTTDEIAALKSQSERITPFNDKLRACTQIVDKWDRLQLRECITQPARLCNRSSIRITTEAFYHLADYHNQYYMSRGGKMHRFLIGLERIVTPLDIHGFKMDTLWGKKRPDDVDRRYDNIRDVYAE